MVELKGSRPGLLFWAAGEHSQAAAKLPAVALCPAMCRMLRVSTGGGG